MEAQTVAVTERDISRAISILSEAGATKVLLFGSAVDDPRLADDLDLACAGIEGWEFFHVLAALQDGLEVPVDLVRLTPATRFTRYIEKRGRVIYERR